jgi:hypothetical protein
MEKENKEGQLEEKGEHDSKVNHSWNKFKAESALAVVQTKR